MDKTEEMAKEINEKIDGLKSQIEGSVTKDELKSANEALESFQKENKETLEGYQKTINELKDSLKEQGEAMTKLKEKGNGIEEPKTMASQIKEHKDELKLIAQKESSKEVVIKADTLRASIVSNAQATELSSIGQLAHKKLTAYDIFPKIPVSETNNNGVIRYYDWDKATTVRAATMVAEGAAFPESTAKWITRTEVLRKIGDTLPVSSEFYEDEAMFAAELGLFLNTNVAIKRDDQIVNGDGTGEELNGIVERALVYTAPTSGISDASIYDLLVKMSEGITASFGSKYIPDFALMNIVDINLMKLKKDQNDNYVTPPFSTSRGQEVDGITVIECNFVTANTLVMGDSRYARIYEKSGITLSRGMVNAQFTEDMETLKARVRLLFLIRDADQNGFLKVASISAALTLLAT